MRKIHQADMIKTANQYLAAQNRYVDKVEYKKGRVLFVYSGDNCFLMDFSTDKLQVIEVELNKGGGENYDCK